ncbi:hypothetical protein FACS1894216_01120 [Synergistales bacterium]|nr:hypothetical protein FACS1894216_01120 [Synergistales bacterium]
MSTKLQFLVPVGKSVPGGPYAKNSVVAAPDDVINHPLIKGLLDTGKIRVLGDLDEHTQGVASLKARIAELEAKVAEYETKSAEDESKSAAKTKKITES